MVKKIKKGFTLLELVVVIVITGALTYMGTEIALNIYKNYLQSRAINTLETQTEIVLEQISKRLAIRVKGSSIGRKKNSYEDFISLQDPSLNQDYNILEWISYSYESFQNGGWSGFADLKNTMTSRTGVSEGTILTPQSNLGLANNDISDLTNKKATLKNNKVGVIFKGIPTDIKTSFGFDGSNTADSIAIVKDALDDITLKIDFPQGNQISEQYYLLHTAYAVVPSNPSNNGDFDLMLHYNYRPWIAGEKYNSTETSKQILATNVTRFNFTSVDGMVVLKLCIRDAGRSLNKDEAEVTVCKTKAIY